MVNEHRLRELTWHELNDTARANKVVLLPVGSIEQHGPHLPLDDGRTVEFPCEEAAKRRPEPFLTSPAIHYGFKVHNRGLPGCLNAPIESILACMYDVAHSMTVSGFKKSSS